MQWVKKMPFTQIHRYVSLLNPLSSEMHDSSRFMFTDLLLLSMIHYSSTYCSDAFTTALHYASLTSRCTPKSVHHELASILNDSSANSLWVWYRITLTPLRVHSDSRTTSCWIQRQSHWFHSQFTMTLNVNSGPLRSSSNVHSDLPIKFNPNIDSRRLQYQFSCTPSRTLQVPTKTTYPGNRRQSNTGSIANCNRRRSYVVTHSTLHILGGFLS